MTRAHRTKVLASRLSATLGRTVDVTIRSADGLKGTISTDNIDIELPQAVANFFGKLATIESFEHDDEIGSFVYFTINSKIPAAA